MPGSLSTVKGTGYPDYRRRTYGTQAVRVLGGSIDISGTIEHINAVGTLRYVGTVRQVGRVGTIQQVGTVRYIQAGSLGRVERVGTIGQVGRVGTAHPGTVPTELFSRRGVYTTIRGNIRLGAGSIWLGSWQHVGSYEHKTFVFKVGNPGTTGGGSVAIITALQGTGATGGIGTYFGPVRIGKGSYTPLSFTEAVRYVRPWIRQHGAGAVAEHGGTVTTHLGLRP